MGFWVDHTSSLVYVTFHQSKAVTELLNSKKEFEEWAIRYNVPIHSIQVDNGVYDAQAFKDSCIKQRQKLNFCAVGAHWQNGIAEWFIGTITERARTILLHAMYRWPSVITEDLWPFAVWHAVAFQNASTRKGQHHCPHYLFTGEEPPSTLSDFHVFGSPVYILKKELQDGSKIGKWSDRSWQGIYIGHLSCHSGSIPLICNLATTCMSPQLHIILDKFFQTVSGTEPTSSEDQLDHLFNTSANWSYQGYFTDTPYTFDTFWDELIQPQSPQPTTSRKHKKFPQPMVVPLTINETSSEGNATQFAHSTINSLQGSTILPPDLLSDLLELCITAQSISFPQGTNHIG